MKKKEKFKNIEIVEYKPRNFKIDFEIYLFKSSIKYYMNYLRINFHYN